MKKQKNKNVPIWLQIIGIIFTIIAAAWTLFSSGSNNQIHSGSGDIVGGDKHVEEYKKFSDTQSIMLVPSEFGGNDTINLDHVATLFALGLNDQKGQVTFVLNLIPRRTEKLGYGQAATTSLDSNTSTVFNSGGFPGIRGEMVSFVIDNDTKKYIFDNSLKSHEIAVGGRTFLVTLISINRTNLKELNFPSVYKFNISEK